MIAPDTVHGGMNGISVRVIALTAGEVVCSWQCVYGISPPWGRGSPGRGEAETSPPSPVSACHPKTSLARSPPRPASAHRREPLQRPEPVLKLPVLRLHPPERPADPLHIPVRLVRPSSRVVFSSVIRVTFPGDSRMPEGKCLAVRVISVNWSQIQAFR